jgi:hypothetical protein
LPGSYSECDGLKTLSYTLGYVFTHWIEIRRRMRGSAIRGTMSMREMLMEMSKLRMVKQGDSKVLTEITKKQRGILEAMSIKVKDLVIN